ncbi:MAG: hypothetical protein WBG46_09565 [Nonlabens sp.]
MKFYIATISIVLLIMGSCRSKKNYRDVEYNLNIEVDEEYRKFAKLYSEKLTPEDLKVWRKLLEENLSKDLNFTEPLVIHFYQKAPYCVMMGYDFASQKALDHSVEFYAKIDSTYNAKSYHVFSQNVFFRDEFSKNLTFIGDNGFFHENVFTEHNICKGFFILKPSGSFYKYYGEDYYYQIKDALLVNEK